MVSSLQTCIFFFFNDTATTEIYTLSLHDALPISTCGQARGSTSREADDRMRRHPANRATSAARQTLLLYAHGHFRRRDRKSTRLNSSHSQISYAVFCLKKKKKKEQSTRESKSKIT